MDGDYVCCNMGTMAVTIWGQGLLQHGDNGCYKTGEMVVTIRGQWLLQYGAKQAIQHSSVSLCEWVSGTQDKACEPVSVGGHSGSSTPDDQ